MTSKLQAFEGVIEERGGTDAFLDLLATSADLETVAKQYGCSLRTLNLWPEVSEERRKSWDDARRVSAHALAAEAKKILDDLRYRSTPREGYRPERLESAMVALESGRAQQRMKLAAALNPVYSDRPVVQVNNNVNVGQLHLQALQKHGSMPAIAAKSEVIPEAEYEIEEKAG